MRWPSKTCPHCHYRFGIWEFFRIRAYRFECPSCIEALATDMRWFFVAVVLVSFGMASPISSAVRDPVYWPLVAAGMFASFFVYYAAFGVTSVGSGQPPIGGSADS